LLKNRIDEDIRIIQPITQRVTAVNDELREDILCLDKKAKKHLLKVMAKSMEEMSAF
jgi:hypothetical protein